MTAAEFKVSHSSDVLESAMPRVLIVQAQVKQYRVPFFATLHERLADDGVELRVAYSPARDSEALKKDNAQLSHSFAVRVPGYWMLRGRILYQPLMREIARADFVIVEHANKHLVNHVLLAMRTLGLKRFAYWGLGSNKQSDRSITSEWLKRVTLSGAEAYFAYTRGVAEEIAKAGLPRNRIIAVQNSVDTYEFSQHVASVTDAERENVRQQFGIANGAPVGLFCGMLDPVKGVPFLIESAELIRRNIPGFHLLIVGGGHDHSAVSRLADGLPWVHAVGPKFGREKAVLFSISDLLLLSGRVGLVILDSFAAGLPLITVRIPIHGPEIEYLEDGVNGFVTDQDPAAYADTAVRVLKSPELLHNLRLGARRSADKYTLDAMVENFRIGILRSLQAVA